MSSKFSESDGNRYHVHQELINLIQVMDGGDDDFSLIMKGYICTKCENYLSQNKLPMYSVAMLDFGLLSRHIPEQLHPIELLLISRHRPLAITLKLSHGGSGPDGMIGHCISFAQRGPESFLTVMPSVDNDLFNRIVVTFMGRRNMPEDIATFLRLVPTANVRPELVIMHLRALKAINPYWDSMLINDSLENREAMHAVPGQIFASRNVIDDPTIMALDRIAYDNPAQAVDTANIQALPVVVDTQHTNTVSFDHVFLNPRDGDESIAIADPLSGQQRMVEAIRNLGHVMEGETTEEQGQEHPLINPPLNTNCHLVFDLEDDTTEHYLTNIDAVSTIDTW